MSNLLIPSVAAGSPEDPDRSGGPGMKLTVAVIAKACFPGKVKTRLTPPLAAGQAAVLAQISLSQTLHTVRGVPAGRRLLVMDGTPLSHDAAGFDVVAQGSGGLDERLAAICDMADGPLLILGMDTPQLTLALLAPLLEDWSRPRPHHHAWLGPANDGGFWALALYVPVGNLIRGVQMSTRHTGRDQLARLRHAGLDVGQLCALSDVDTFPAALEAAADCPGTPFAAAVLAAAGTVLPDHRISPRDDDAFREDVA
ncbi:DUF2064 domain-containing protein [Paenarthrobacter sp. PH39-S1]|uniref:TIGR04282 family arsenosugar biosynthesis glycosyltransferase n=1 Tax=Paenarthrobacter sp. PH39-S1 TaxID=3046204 RepID=UPI0024B9C645|nr:DUF2064 domain-containing protein [Paenarthrobacter sp. PH39-S1]MDJ0355242.1 DUF2064 domain-containing protein [Paenarthrobacter sp. PH39-S1]